MLFLGKFPQVRMRRLRRHAWSRALVQETRLHKDDFILPLFVKESGSPEYINHMGKTQRHPLSHLCAFVENAIKKGICSFFLFPCLDADKKTDTGEEALNPSSLIYKSVRLLRSEFGSNIGLITDIALDPYTSHGHDGILDNNGYVDNEKTVKILEKCSLLSADAGADFLAPSDMMDGRICHIREALDLASFSNIGIISYAAKFSSAMYNPFRGAVKAGRNLGKDGKKTYQLDIHNAREPLREIALDMQEGADAIIIKPASLYADIIARTSAEMAIPTLAYHVSGEYALLVNGAEQGIVSYADALYEHMVALKRAGAQAIITYGAIDMADML